MTCGLKLVVLDVDALNLLDVNLDVELDFGLLNLRDVNF